jgi:DNA polymerase/3'-5' exonuclease PolX
MRFDDLADALDEIALHYRVENRDHIARQYQLASSALRQADFIPPDPSQLDDVGEAIRDDIAEWRAFGEITRLTEMQEDRPYLSELTQIAKIGPKTAQTINQETGASSIEDIRELADEEKLEEISGIGPKTATTIRRSIAQIDK